MLNSAILTNFCLVSDRIVLFNENVLLFMLIYNGFINDLWKWILNTYFYNFSLLSSKEVNFKNSPNQRLFEILNNF